MSAPGDSQIAPPPSESGVRSQPFHPRLVVIGNFDGVHLGHQAVLDSASREAADRGLRLTVLTFEPHPAKVLAGRERAPLTPAARKVKLLRSLAPKVEVVVQPFDLKLAELSPEQFCRLILKDKLQARVVLVGDNFRFGKDRAGDLSTLQRLGKELDFEARSEILRGDAGGVFSSTRVRTLLSSGDVGEAAKVLGRPHYLSGTVALGDQRGRTLGFRTANLEGVAEVLPLDGVYAVRVYDESKPDAGPIAPGVANFGTRPTVKRPHALEVHLLDFDGDLYGKQLGIACLERIRDVAQFESLQVLRAQIGQDAAAARQVHFRFPQTVG